MNGYREVKGVVQKKGLFRSETATLLKIIAGAALLCCLTVSCDRYPVNPGNENKPVEIVNIQYQDTEYINADLNIDGMFSPKVNIVQLSILNDNISAQALEIHGIVVFAGPPYLREHAFTFVTDSILFCTGNLGLPLETWQELSAGSTYTMHRPILPPNEYSPFENDQGKVDSIEIKNVWLIDESGKRHEVEFSFSR